MCQVGAAGLAELGRDYRAILAKYYQGCTIAQRY
jgi:peptidoglycan hydrolase-like amidase